MKFKKALIGTVAAALMAGSAVTAPAANANIFGSLEALMRSHGVNSNVSNSNIGVVTENTYQLEERIAADVNRTRTNHQLRPVVKNETMTREARAWANYLARTGQYYHDPLNTQKNYGENINAAFGTQVYNTASAWFNSPGHQRNMLWPTAKTYGMGVAEANGKYIIVYKFAM